MGPIRSITSIRYLKWIYEKISGTKFQIALEIDQIGRMYQIGNLDQIDTIAKINQIGTID